MSLSPSRTILELDLLFCQSFIFNLLPLRGYICLNRKIICSLSLIRRLIVVYLVVSIWTVSQGFHCLPMLNWNSSDSSSILLLKILSQFSGSLFVILSDAVVKFSSNMVWNCREIYLVMISRTRAKLPACCGDISR